MYIYIYIYIHIYLDGQADTIRRRARGRSIGDAGGCTRVGVHERMRGLANGYPPAYLRMP